MLEKKINPGENEVSMEIDTKIYTKDSVFKASKIFTEDFWVSVDGGRDGILLVKIKPKSGNPDLKKVALEFYNFILGITKEGSHD